MKVYIMVSFPEIQDFMEHPRWNECIFCQSIEGHECPDSTYMVPKDLYEGIESYAFAKDNLGKYSCTKVEKLKLLDIVMKILSLNIWTAIWAGLDWMIMMSYLSLRM